MALTALARGAVRVLLAALICGLALSGGLAHAEKRSGIYKASFTGKAVKFDLSGFEPDFDPIYAVIIDAALRDTHAGGSAVPTSKLVLSMYLESFKPDTTPVLPDLLHPDRNAVNLAGFLHGAAALVNDGGHIVYRGSMLAEIFQDSSVHFTSALYSTGANSAAAPVLLDGTFTLFKGGREAGTLYAVRPGATTAEVTTPAPLPAGAVAALSFPPAHMPSWQQVVQGLSVSLPPMMGTGGTSGAGGTPPAAVSPLPTSQAQAAPTAAPAPAPAGITVGGITLTPPLIAAAVLVVVLALLPWERLLARRRPGPGAGKVTSAEAFKPAPGRPGVQSATPENAAKERESSLTPPE